MLNRLKKMDDNLGTAIPVDLAPMQNFLREVLIENQEPTSFLEREGNERIRVMIEEDFSEYPENDAYNLERLVLALLCKIIYCNYLDNAARSTTEEAVTAFLNTSHGMRIQEVASTLIDTLDTPQSVIDSKKTEIAKLLDVIDGVNSSILPALLHPDPLVEECEPFRLPGVNLPRCPAEAYEAYLFVAEVPGVTLAPVIRSLLVDRFGGEQPQYHHSPFDYPPPPLPLV